MTETHAPQDARIARLERRVRRSNALAGGACLGLAALVGAGLSGQDADVQDLVRARRIELVDDKGVVRVRMGQDAEDAGRRSRAAGITVHDAKGDERGGFSTLDDGSVVLAMDAPHGVGAPMPDRIGLVVWPDGSSYVMLLDNQTRAVAKLHSDGEGGGGVQVFEWDVPSKEVHVKTLTFDGEEIETHETDGG